MADFLSVSQVKFLQFPCILFFLGSIIVRFYTLGSSNKSKDISRLFTDENTKYGVITYSHLEFAMLRGILYLCCPFPKFNYDFRIVRPSGSIFGDSTGSYSFVKL